MRVQPNIRKFQMGGPVGPEEGAAPVEEEGAPMEEGVPEEGGDPIMQIIQMAAQALQTQDPTMAFQVCEALVSLAQQGQQAPQGEPVYRRGGKLVGHLNR